MTNILLNGIPKIGKTEIIEDLKRLSRGKLGEGVGTISLGDIVAEAAHEVFRIEKERIPYLDYSFLQMTLRPGAISKARLEIRDTSENHLLVDTPLTMYTQAGVVPEVIFSQEQIQRLHSEKPFNFVVSLIDEPSYVRERLVGTPYPREIGEVLDWMTLESQLGRKFAPYDHLEEGMKVPHYVFPVEKAAENLLKLLYDNDPTIIYSMGPITHMKEEEFDSKKHDSREEWHRLEERKKQDKGKLNEFRNELQSYAAVVVPLTMADASKSPKAVANTVFRDLNFFVPQSRLLIAYYPGNYHSSGVSEEMRHGLRMGKPVVMIHPHEDEEAFGIRPTLRFGTKEEFFEVLKNYEKLIGKRPELNVLRPLLDNEFKPRYAKLR